MNSVKRDQSPKRPPEDAPNNTLSSIKLRPSVGHGWWLSYLVVGAYLVNCWKFDKSISFEYKFSTTIALGMVLQTEAIHFSPKIKNQPLRYVLQSIPTITISSILVAVLYQGVVFSIFSGLTTILMYHALFSFILRKMPKSFTYGEASIVVQGFVIFFINLYFKLLMILEKTTECVRAGDDMSCMMSTTNSWIQDHVHHSEMEQLCTILQIGLLGVTFLVGCCYFVTFFRGVLFYALLISVGVVVILFPIDDNVAVVILVQFLTKDLQKLCMMVLYMGLIGMTVAAVIWQMNRNEQGNTRTRKIFHILIVLVFVPGLIYQCAFLYVASGIALALLIVLETMRVIKLPPIYNVLEQSVKCFIDEKDAGLVALTPIYLLVGCSTPLWIHPCPCDLTDSAGFELLPLMAGVISVGIGDTASSIIGSQFGRIKWPNSKKTVEGTIAGIIAQALILPLFIYFGLIRYSALLVTKILVAVTVSSLVETFTDQVDNLVLPLVTYILLSV